MIEEEAHPLRGAQVLVHGEPDLQAEADLVGEDGHQVTVPGRDPRLATGDPDACTQRGKLRRVTVAAEPEHVPRNLEPRLADGAERGVVPIEADETMVSQVGDALWQAPCRHIGPMGEEANAHLAHSLRDERGLLWALGAHGDIGVAAQKILDPIADRELHLYAWMRGAKGGENAWQNLASQDLTGGDTHASADNPGLARRGALEGRLRRRHGFRVGNQLQRGRRCQQASVGPREESDTKRLLERGNMAADRRLPETQPASRARQTAVPHHVEEGAVEVPRGGRLGHAFMYIYCRKIVNSRLAAAALDMWCTQAGAHLMSSTRRTFLKAAGGAGVMLVGAEGVFVATRRPEAALRAWEAASTASPDARLDAFRHAILAPNPHNRQPWQIRLVGPSEAIILCDLDRRLPQTDPFDRQITIGFGCFLELARIAAAERGFRLETTLFPEGEPQPRLTAAPVAHLRFTPDATVEKDPLFGAILIRRSSKVPFDTSRAVETQGLAALAHRAGALAFASNEAAFVADVRSITWRAWLIEAGTARTWQESVDLMRIGRAEIEANPDGITLSGAILETLALTGQLSRASLADPNSAAFKRGVERYRPMLEQTPGYLWIKSSGNTRSDQIASGRAYMRANLAAAAAGLSMHPVSQALQEFPEMASELDALHRHLDAAAPQRIQMLARVGYAPPVEAAARWPLEAKLMAPA
jgi:hypothetical protein